MDCTATTFTITTWDLAHTYKGYYNSPEFRDTPKSSILPDDNSCVKSILNPSEVETEIEDKLITYKEDIVDIPGAFEATVGSDFSTFRHFRMKSDKNSLKFNVRYA
jgi:hypothetical protein